MTLEEQYTRILRKEKTEEIIPFLKNLSAGERKSLVPTIKKLSKEYSALVTEGSTIRARASQKHSTILGYSYIVCYNKTEFEKENPAWAMSRDTLEKILPWYEPPWLSDYINGFTSRDWFPYQMDYGYVVELTERGILQPDPQIIALLLPRYVYEFRDRKNYFTPERLLEHERTLKEHIWHLFAYESTVNFSNSYLYQDNGKQIERGWLDVFQLYVGENKIDRQRVLREALLASNRNFNKNLSGWFATLFLQLKPTKEELLSFQAELFNLFSSPHSKVVNTALQVIKPITGEAGFKADHFLDNATILLSSSTKTVVSTTLQIMDKLAKKHKNKRAQICQLATVALIHKEESLQSRAAKLIDKFGDEKDESLPEAILQYRDVLFSGPKALLGKYLAAQNKEGDTDGLLAATRSNEPKGSLQHYTTLPSFETVDDLIFLSTQAFDNNESWHFDLLPATLIRLQHQINGDHLSQLEPAIQRALKLCFGDWRSAQGELDHLLARFFLDYNLWLIQQYPEQGKTAHELFRSMMNKSEADKKLWEQYGTNITFLNGWKAEGARFLYKAHFKLLKWVLNNLKQRKPLPVLSAPTHAPAWIDPAVLIERLYQYQEQQAVLDVTDLQIAISRCWLHGTEEALELAEKKLKGEFKRLMLFLLGKDSEPVGPFGNETAWMIAALSKSPQTVYAAFKDFSYAQNPLVNYTGQYPYKIFSEPFTYNENRWIDGQYIRVKKTTQQGLIQIDFQAQKEQQPKVLSGFKKLLNKLSGKEEVSTTETPPLLYDYLRIKEKWLSIEDRDIRRVYMLTPNNPEPLLALTIDKCLSNEAFFSETARRFVIQVAQALNDTWKPLGEMGHLFIAICFLSQDKTIANYATEIWLRAVEEESINNKLLGTLIGKQESIELAPLKRFTDLLVRSLLNVSPEHNKALEELLTMMLRELSETPAKGLKKLLEIYFEVLLLNGHTVDDEIVLAKLQTWKKTDGLRKAIGRM